MKTPANFLSIIFVLIASFSIHEFYFAALNKSNYHLPLFCVAHFKCISHTDSHKAEGPDRMVQEGTAHAMSAHPGLCLTWAARCSQPCQIMAGLWGSSAGYQGAVGGLSCREGPWRSGNDSGGR